MTDLDRTQPPSPDHAVNDDAVSGGAVGDATTPAVIYRLDDQIGFVLRRATQRHLAIFFDQLPDITPTQFAALAKLCELGEVSQNELGRRVAMDAATIKGVVDRLRARGFAESAKDPNDMRRLVVRPTVEGRRMFDDAAPVAARITAETLKPLTSTEADRLLVLLSKLA